jgi:hypothetical protein
MVRFLRKIYKKYINPYWAGVIGLIVIGCIFILIHQLLDKNYNPKFFWSTYLLPITGILGNSILAGGFFAFFLKSFQLIGIFRDEISNVIFGEDFLTNTTMQYKKEVWKNITNSLYHSSFPDISDKIATIVQNIYIPDELNFYHEDMTIIYEFKELDDNYIEISEKQTFKIKSNSKEIKFGSYTEVFKDTSTDNSDIFLSQFTIDEENIACLPYMEKKSDAKKVSVTIAKKLNNKEVYNVVKYLKTTHSTESNVFWKNVFSRYTKRVELILPESPNLEVDFLPFGLNIAFNKIPNSEISRHEDLLLPGEGYAIIIKKKTH